MGFNSGFKGLRLILLGEQHQNEVSRNLGKLGLTFISKNTRENLINYLLKVAFIDRKEILRFI